MQFAKAVGKSAAFKYVGAPFRPKQPFPYAAGVGNGAKVEVIMVVVVVSSVVAVTSVVVVTSVAL